MIIVWRKEGLLEPFHDAICPQLAGDTKNKHHDTGVLST